MKEKEVLLELEGDIQQEAKINEDIKNDKVLFFKLLRKIRGACSQTKINLKKIEHLRKSYEILQSIETLKLLNDEKYKASLATKEDKKHFKDRIQEELLNKFYEKCKEGQGDLTDLCFLAAATCNTDALKKYLKGCDRDALVKPRYCDSILNFMLKYGNISNTKFFECAEILIEADIDVNMPDFNGKTAVEHVFILYKRSEEQYKRNKEDEFKRKCEILIYKLKQKDIFWELLEEQTRNFIQNFKQEVEIKPRNLNRSDSINQLFYWIGKENTKEIQNFKNIKVYANCDNGEITLLQFACKKSEKMHSVVKFLLESGADPNKVTEIYTFCPLEIAARRKYEQSFQEILKNKKLVISEKTFNNFVQWRSRSVKPQHFEMFLESNKLDPKFTYKSSGNTPLHYAVRFSHKKAVQNILKRSEDLLNVPNKSGKSALDAITVSDLEAHFDACLALDNYNDFGSDEYKMHLRFGSLISTRNDQNDEVKIVSKISKIRNLEQLLNHPLIHSFLVLKWYKVEVYYKLLLLLQVFLFLNLSVWFYLLSDSSSYILYLCIIFAIFNFLIKILFLSAFCICGKFRFPTLYESVEILLVLTLVGAFFLVEFRAFAFVEMSILLLLTVGYHPKIAKWSVMLKKVFQTFTFLMMFFSLIVIAFAVAFHLLFKHESHKFFQTIFKSIFVTSVMITGEFNMNENFRFSGMGGYVLFFFFAIFVALVMVNFWTGVAVTDINSIEKDAQINAFKNVITFLDIVENRFWRRKLVPMLHLPNPSLFSDNKYDVDFYINRENQFGPEDFPENVGWECLEKIKLFCCSQMDSSKDKHFLKRLEGLEKTLIELKNIISYQTNLIREYVPQKERKKS